MGKYVKCLHCQRKYRSSVDRSISDQNRSKWLVPHWSTLFKSCSSLTVAVALEVTFEVTQWNISLNDLSVCRREHTLPLLNSHEVMNLLIECINYFYYPCWDCQMRRSINDNTCWKTCIKHFILWHDHSSLANLRTNSKCLSYLLHLNIWLII